MVLDDVGISDLKGIFVGWGICFFDFDVDGDEDMFVMNGYLFYNLSGGEMVQCLQFFFNNDGYFVFVDMKEYSYLGKKYYGRGMVWGDFNVDEGLDFVFSNVGEVLVILVSVGINDGDVGKEIYFCLIGVGFYCDVVGVCFWVEMN